MKILIVLTSHDQLGDTGKKTGFWLEEFAAPYYLLRDAGAAITLASPKGGQPPLDPKSDLPENLTEATKRFRADKDAQAALASTKTLTDVSANAFDAVFYPGGHGPLWDLSDNATSIALIEAFVKADKPVVAVCHAPAAFVNVRGKDGQYLVRGKRVTGFTNAEEQAVGLTEVVPFLLEDRLKERGGLYNKGASWAPYVQVDGNLVTGQNPASSGPAARELLKLLRSIRSEGTTMADMMSREIRLASRPKGIPTAANFTMAHTKLDPTQEGEVLVRNLFMSVDPYMRGRMNDGKSYVPPFELGKPLDGGAVGEVIESRAKEFKPGDTVTSNFGWREYFCTSPKNLHPVSREIQPLSVYLGALGMTGMTAWVGLNLVEVKAGDVVLISGAAGAVGNVAGQLAKLRGCRVIGSTGSAAKVAFLLEECGFDAAFNYKTGPVLEQLNRVAPEGIDVYFDNVGGETLEAALSALREHGRIIACGGISAYNDEKPRPGPSNLFNVITKRLTMKGLIVRDWLDRQGDFEREVGGYLRTGKMKNQETVVKGIDKAVDAFIGLFQGQNVGKMVVELA